VVIGGLGTTSHRDPFQCCTSVRDPPLAMKLPAAQISEEESATIPDR
jgi:hypothetical protein